LFLSFGLSIGSQIWDAFGPEQPGPDLSGDKDDVTVTGTFFGNNTIWNQAMSNGMHDLHPIWVTDELMERYIHFHKW
jgi:hypothetical protein